MKKINFLAVICILFFGTISMVAAAEYKIDKGESIGVIAEKLNQPIECLCFMNKVDGESYKIIAGKTLRYLSFDDITDALAFAEYYIFGLNPNDEELVQEYDYFVQIIMDIKSRKIKCADDQEGIHPLEILALSEAEKIHKWNSQQNVVTSN